MNRFYRQFIMQPAVLAAGLILLHSPLKAQEPVGNTPAADGLRFNRVAAKGAKDLAQKAGGPTERIEIQSTNDHIDYVVKTYVLKQANAAEVFKLVIDAVRLEGGRVDPIASGSVVECEDPCGEIKINYTGESMIVVTAPDWMIPYIDDTVAKLDRPNLRSGDTGTGVIHVYPKHRRPSELAELLKATVASGDEIIVGDDSRNSLYIEDIPSYFPYVLQEYNLLDVPPEQLDTVIRIYEIDDAKLKDVGVDWEAWKSSIVSGNLDVAWDNSGNPGSYDLDLKSFSTSFGFYPTLATNFLNYLANNGNAKVITDTRVMLVNGRPADVEALTEIPYIVRNYLANDDVDQPHRDSPEALDENRLIKEFSEGVSVNIIPTIASETMELDVRAMVASHVGYTPNQTVPIITRSRVQSNLVLESGKPAVLGGLTRETVVKENSGIIGLKNIPYLKMLFSREVERKHRSQILVTITPVRVLPGHKPAVKKAEMLAPNLDNKAKKKK